MSPGSSLGHLILREYKPIGRYLKHLLDELGLSWIQVYAILILGYLRDGIKPSYVTIQ